MLLFYQKMVIFGLLFLTISSCAIGPKVNNGTETGEDQLLIGTGGGFTGRETVYLLTKRGLLYQKKGAHFEKVAKMDSKWVQQVFFIYEAQKFGNMTIQSPGNTYYFVERHEAGTSKKLVWGKEPGEPEILVQYHRFIWQQIAIVQDQKNI